MAVPCAHPDIRKSPGSTLADVFESCPKWVRALSLSTELAALGNFRVFFIRGKCLLGKVSCRDRFCFVWFMHFLFEWKKKNPDLLIHQLNSCLFPQKTKVVQLEDLASHLGLRTQVSTDFWGGSTNFCWAPASLLNQNSI